MTYHNVPRYSRPRAVPGEHQVGGAAEVDGDRDQVLGKVVVDVGRRIQSANGQKLEAGSRRWEHGKDIEL